MKKTQFIELIKDIKKSKISFISVIIFVLLGLGLYCGFDWFNASFYNAINTRFEEGNSSTIKYIFYSDIDKDNLNEILNVEGVDEVEGAKMSFGSYTVDHSSYLAAVFSLPESINEVTVVSGRLPEKDNEIVVNNVTLQSLDLEIGQEIEFNFDDADSYFLINSIEEAKNINELSDIDNDAEHCLLKNNKFTLVGVVDTPSIISYDSQQKSPTNGSSVSSTFYVSEGAFNDELLNGYNVIYVRNNELETLDIFSDEYTNALNKFKEKVDACINSINTDNKEEIETQYNVLEDDYDDQMSSALTSITNGEETLEQAKNTIALNDNKLKSAKAELDSAAAALAEGKTKLEDAKAQLASAYTLLSTKQSEYDSSKASYEYYKGLVNNVEDYIEKIKAISALDTNTNKTFIEEIAETIAGYNASTSAELIEDINNSDDTYVGYFRYIVGSENLKLFADKLTESGSLNDSTKISEYIRSTVVYTFNKSLLEAIEYNRDVFSNDSDYNTLVSLLEDCTFDYCVSYYSDSDKYANEFIGFIISTADEYAGLADDKLDSINNELNTASTTLSQKWNEYNSGLNEYNSSLSLYKTKTAEYEEGLAEYKDGCDALASARVQVMINEKKLEDAKQEYDEALVSYQSFKELGDSIDSLTYLSFTDGYNGGINVAETAHDLFNQLKYGLSGLFGIIAIIICFNVLCQQISDKIKMIGTKKALGFNSKEILTYYLTFSGLMAIIGTALSALLAYAIAKAFPLALSVYFIFSIEKTCISIKQILLLGLLTLIVFEIVTYLACKNTLKKKAIDLLNIKPVSFGKVHFYEKFKSWQKLPVFVKATINNFIDDRRRVLATIFGVASCTLLIVTSITLRDNVVGAYNKQWTDYFHFDTSINFSGEEACNTIVEKLDELGIEYATASKNFVYATGENESHLVFMWVYEDKESLNGKFDFETVDGSEFNYDGYWISYPVVKEYGYQVGDEINIQTLDGDDVTVKIAGSYIIHMPNSNDFVDAKTYKEFFGKDYEPNVILLDKGDYTIEELSAMFENVSGYNGTKNFVSDANKTSNTFKMIATVIVCVYTIVSFLLGIFVILFLINNHIKDKKREAIILMINGYSMKKVKIYMCLDTIVLTVIGIIIGLIIGNYTGDLMVTLMESQYCYYLHQPDLLANVCGALFTVLIVTVMMLVALRKINKFTLREIND